MSHAIPQGMIPPGPGLEKEEPELSNEEDIPRDDEGPSDDGDALEPEPAVPDNGVLRDVERE